MPRNLFATLVALAACLVAPADPPAPPAKNPASAPELVGGWAVTFANGVVETCIICADGTAAVTEPLRTSSGKVEGREGQAVLTFGDGRVERWTAVGERQVVEHFPAAVQFPDGQRVLGIAERLKEPPRPAGSVP